MKKGFNSQVLNPGNRLNTIEYHILPFKMHAFLPKFVREKLQCVLHMGSTNTISI